MSRILTEYEAEWIKVSANAFALIRLVTGYGQRRSEPLDADMAYTVSEIADLLHNIADIGTGNTWWPKHHTPERLARVRELLDELEAKHYDGRRH